MLKTSDLFDGLSIDSLYFSLGFFFAALGKSLLSRPRNDSCSCILPCRIVQVFFLTTEILSHWLSSTVHPAHNLSDEPKDATVLCNAYLEVRNILYSLRESLPTNVNLYKISYFEPTYTFNL